MTPPTVPKKYRLQEKIKVASAEKDYTVWTGITEELVEGMTPAEQRAFEQGGAGPYLGIALDFLPKPQNEFRM